MALAAWHLLPYEALERTAPEERFFLWEAVMWMIGLVSVFFGASAWFGSTDLAAGPGGPGHFAHVRTQMRQGIGGRLLFSDLPAAPWIMIATGLLLIAGAWVWRIFVIG